MHEFKNKTKMRKTKAINLLSAINKIEEIVSSHILVDAIYINFIKYKSKDLDLTLSATIHYIRDGKTGNFTAYVYDYKYELTVENLLIEVKKELKIMLSTKTLTS